jgi:hypothetical protein
MVPWMSGRSALAWAAAAVVALSACYAPAIVQGAPCDPDRGNCPQGQRCTATRGGSFCTVPDDAIVDAAAGDGTAVTGYPAVVLADHPAGYWRLGDATTLALDASGNGITGSYGSGVTQGVPGAIVNDADTAAEFSGQTGAISLGNVFNFTGTTAFSVEAWIRPSVVDDKFRHVFTKQHRATPRQGYALLLHDAEGILFERFVDDDAISASVRVTPPTTSFTHIVCTYDGAVLRLYVNGEPANPVTEGRAVPAINEPALIGAAGATDALFAGSIDEVAVYPAVLSAARVQAHYMAGTVPAAP